MSHHTFNASLHYLVKYEYQQNICILYDHNVAACLRSYQIFNFVVECAGERIFKFRKAVNI